MNWKRYECYEPIIIKLMFINQQTWDGYSMDYCERNTKAMCHKIFSIHASLFNSHSPYEPDISSNRNL